VKALFRRAFIIGRRFRIVHVVYGRGREHEVIEVSTFRAHLDNRAAEQVKGNERTSKSELAGMKHAVDSSGRVLRDNVWGPQDEDATRRDFTVNAMYYDPESQYLVDYHGGMQDSNKKVLRMIGDPVARYREDPVRIIRAVRFAAKLSQLGFKLETKTAKPLAAMLGLLADVPQSRLFDEMLKLLQTGHALASIEQLQKLGLQKGIYPLLDVVVERADSPFVKAALVDTDRRVGEGKPVAPSFLLACVLWADVKLGWDQRLANRVPPFPALQESIDEVFEARIGDVSGRGKLAADMREIWMMQPRFDKRIGSTAFSLVEQARFRAGFDFLRLRAEVSEVELALADWWQEFSMADDAAREDLIQLAKSEKSTTPTSGAVKSRRAPRRKKPESNSAEPD
jgi:poly(A) polymerase